MRAWFGWVLDLRPIHGPLMLLFPVLPPLRHDRRLMFIGKLEIWGR
jgi:hypothetical protein